MMQPSFDTLSAPTRQLIADARAAGAYEQLVVRTQQTQPWHDALARFASPDELFDAKVTRADEARCALAGLWLLGDDLDRAHRVVQEIATAGGSFWHAIVHRREGDFSNSKYWYARCREHRALRGEDPGEPYGPELVTLVEEVEPLPPTDARRLRAIAAQRSEWDRLFGHCARAAVGGGA